MVPFFSSKLEPSVNSISSKRDIKVQHQWTEWLTISYVILHYYYELVRRFQVTNTVTESIYFVSSSCLFRITLQCWNCASSLLLDKVPLDPFSNASQRSLHRSLDTHLTDQRNGAYRDAFVVH